MRKKAILLLILIPFIVSIFAFVTSTVLIRQVESDYTDVLWNYQNTEPFILSEGKKELVAEPIGQPPYDPENALIWESSDSSIASISSEGTGDETKWYLNPHEPGSCTITCSNRKKGSNTPSKTFTAIVVGDDGAIIINPIQSFSQSKISSTDYVGEYDMSYQEVAPGATVIKEAAEVDFSLQIVGNSAITENMIEVEATPNVSVDISNKTIRFLDTGEASITFKNPYGGGVGDGHLNFTIVDEAVNVYNYDDLLMATNYSSEGEKVVMRTNLESLANTYNINADGSLGSKKSSDTELFGHYDEASKSFSFADEVYKFTTSYNHDFVDTWNKTQAGQGDYKEASTSINAGIHVQKDFYGNGFTINLHNLAYPSKSRTVTDPATGNSVTSALLGADDLFRGPLVFVSLGVPQTDTGTVSAQSVKPIYALYGQDNISMYVENSTEDEANHQPIILDDLNIKNCDFGTNFANLLYTGTVLEMYGDDITLRNSRLQNGRNIVRSFSSMNAVIDNCYLSNGYEFLIRAGTYEANHVDLNKSITYKTKNGEETSSVGNYIKPLDLNNPSTLTNYGADSLLTFGAIKGTQAAEFFGDRIPASTYSTQDYIDATSTIAEALTNTDGFFNADGSKNYYSTLTINNTFFSNSGLSAICLDTMPQGSYLQNRITTLFSMLLGKYMPLQPDNLAFTSYPSLVSLTGDNRFFDYKSVSDLDYSSLLFQDIAAFIIAHGGVGSDVTITDDDYLPLRKMLSESYSYLFRAGSEEVGNLPIFFMGGGANYSDVIMDEDNTENFTSEKISLNPYTYSLDDRFDLEWVPDWNNNPLAKYNTMKLAMQRASSDVLGFNDYSYYSLNTETWPFYNQSPDISVLQSRA